MIAAHAMRAFHRCDSFYKVDVPLPVRIVYSIALVIPCLPICDSNQQISRGASRLTRSRCAYGHVGTDGILGYLGTRDIAASQGGPSLCCAASICVLFYIGIWSSSGFATAQFHELFIPFYPILLYLLWLVASVVSVRRSRRRAAMNHSSSNSRVGMLYSRYLGAATLPHPRPPAHPVSFAPLRLRGLIPRSRPPPLPPALCPWRPGARPQASVASTSFGRSFSCSCSRSFCRRRPR